MYRTKLLAVAIATVISGKAMAAAPVSVMEAQSTTITPEKAVVAKYEAPQHTQIRPRISGYISKQLVQDGSLVAKDAPLFLIDDTEYQHNLSRSKAEVAQAMATKTNARLHHERIVNLQTSGGATRADLESAEANFKAARAAYQVALVNLEKAQYDLDSTVVKAPYAGQVGKSQFSVGDMVTPASGSLIDIVQLNPMNVLFTVDYNTYRKFELDDPTRSQVLLSESGTDTHINYVSNKINPTSGTIRVSATFDNSELKVKPNVVTYVTLENSQQLQGVWVPLSALLQDMTLRYVYVVNEEGNAERRNIEAYTEKDGKAFITNGINEGDTVIVDGLIRVRPGTPVAAQDSVVANNKG